MILIHSRDQRMTKMVELLEETKQFTPGEMETIEDYLTGGSEEAVLAGIAVKKFPLRDLAGIPSGTTSKISMLFNELINKGKKDEAEKLADLFFTVGKTSAHAFFPSYWGNIGLLSEDVAKKVAISAVKVGGNQWQLTQYNFKNLLKTASNSSEVLKTALGYQYKTPEGELVLLTLYFYREYPDVRPEAAVKEKEGILAGLSKVLGQHKTGTTVKLSDQDKQLMKRYEDLLTNSIGNLFRGRQNGQTLTALTDAVRYDRLDESILAAVKKGGVADAYLMRFLGGTAFANFALSPCLRNLVTVCLAAGTDAMLTYMDQMDLRGDLKARGGSFDLIFGIDGREYIKWAASKKYKNILASLFERHREAFLSYMDTADFDTCNLMSEVVKEMDSGLYQKRLARETTRQQSKVVDEMVQTVDAASQSTVRDYLRGDAELDALYAREGQIVFQGYRWGGRQWNVLQSYQRAYGCDALVARCEAMLMICRGFSYSGFLVNGGEVKENEVKRVFAAVDGEKLALKNQLNGYADMYDSMYSDRWKQAFTEICRKIFRGYLEERRDELVSAVCNAGSTGRCFGLSLLSEKPQENKDVFFGFAQDSSKAVREVLLGILYGHKEWEQDVMGLLSSKKASEREIAVKVLAKWELPGYQEVLGKALEKEKNGKVRTQLESALHIQSMESAETAAASETDLVKDLHKGNKKKGLAWAYETPFSVVHTKQGEEAAEEYLQAILLAYSGMSPCGISPSAAALAHELNEKELAVYVNELFDKWLEAGAESKKRWVLYAAAIHGGADIIKKLKHQIQEWPQAARGAIASEAVQALALNPLPQALLEVDGIARKFKFKQVKAAAGKALEFAASQLGITTEELADRIVPNLGFNENMERIFDYGERKFTVTITPALEIEVFDESGKKLKNLPSPGKRDDEEKASAAYEDFKQMKKQMKATVTSQKSRLEMALSTGREWSVEAWKNLFVKNPIMHQFAIGLIWGVYEDQKLVSSFRYMEDGSFNTEDEDEFELPEEQQAKASGQAQDASGAQTAGSQLSGKGQMIGLVHPIELEEESLKAWKEQLEDYEIKQPFEQLNRAVYYRTREEEESKSLERFGGCIVNDLSMGGKLQTMGWYRGSVQDAGCFYSYYREDGIRTAAAQPMGVELHFSGSYVGGENEDVTVYEVRFYKMGGIDEKGEVTGIRRGSYVYDEANDDNSYLLKEVPERYFSEIVLQITRALAASKERDENWKKRS